LIHGYGENLICDVCCYTLEEIIAEKLCTLLQTHKSLIKRGWNRSRSRDYYDLWRIFREFSSEVSSKKIVSLFEKKSIHRGISFKGVKDFFSNELVSEAYRHWSTTLGLFVAELPQCKRVLSELRILLGRLFSKLD